MNEKIVKADNKLRLVVVGVLIGLAALAFGLKAWWLDPYFLQLTELAKEDPAAGIQEVKFVLYSVFTTLWLFLLVIQLFAFRAARKVIKQQQYPAQGAWILADTLVLTGEQAVKRGKLMMVMSTAITILITLAFFFSVFLLTSLLDDVLVGG